MVLRDPKVSVVRDFPARSLRFASPAPLSETGTGYEDHQKFARAESGKVHVLAGKGSWVFVMARFWAPPGVSPARRTRPAAYSSKTARGTSSPSWRVPPGSSSSRE